MGDDAPQMSSHRPYLLRALYEWIVDNGMTPHVLVDATQPGVRVPTHAVKDGRIVLNIAERAVAHLALQADRCLEQRKGIALEVGRALDAVHQRGIDPLELGDLGLERGDTLVIGHRGQGARRHQSPHPIARPLKVWLTCSAWNCSP